MNATVGFLSEEKVRSMFIVDLFAGGGGASQGIKQGLGREPNVAVNHDEEAIIMHLANHPDTEHYCESVYDVDPIETCCTVNGFQRPGLVWASPDCTHFSRAKGDRPRSKEIRSLAWTVVYWAETAQPDVIILENVPEFQTWGPLDDEGKPIKSRKGETFDEWIDDLRQLGYVVEWRVLIAADYGAPTTRKRLFLVARRDGLPIVWPKQTHASRKKNLPLPTWLPASGCIDWDIPVPSIFTRKRPLAEKTQARIAEGLRRFVIESPDPFLLCLTHGGRLEPLSEPFKTITAAHRGERALVTPYLAHLDNQSSGPGAVHEVDAPVSTVTTKARHLLLAPHLINTRNGERRGQAPRARDIAEPAPTVTAKGSQGALVATWLAKHYTGVVGHEVSRPLGSVTAKDHHAICHAHLTTFYGNSIGTDPRDPVRTVTSSGAHHGVVAAFLMKYYGNGGQWSGLDEPTHTVVSKARMGLVTINIGGEEYAIVDIGMRMLQPRELANAQGFPADYYLHGTKTTQVAKIGNSVPPPVAEALARAQFFSSSKEAPCP